MSEKLDTILVEIGKLSATTEQLKDNQTTMGTDIQGIRADVQQNTVDLSKHIQESRLTQSA